MKQRNGGLGKKECINCDTKTLEGCSPCRLMGRVSEKLAGRKPKEKSKAEIRLEPVKQGGGWPMR